MKDLYYATVINNNAPLKNGSVQIRIPALMDGITNDTDLPWALPWNFGTGGSDESGESHIPEIGSLVWTYFDDPPLNKKIFYVSGVNLKNFGPHSLFDNNVKSNITGFTSSYPDVKFSHYKNGINIAVSSSDTTPEIVVYHPEGAYIFIDSTGNISLKGANGSTVQPTLLGQTFITALTTFLSGLNTTTLAGQATTFLSLINTFLSPTTKNN